MSPTLLALIGSLAGGVALAVQSAVNGRLAKGLADPVAAACISFAVGLAVLLAATLPRLAALDWRSASDLPWWAWTGGALGAFYVAAITIGVTRLGVLTLVAAVVLGQVAAALLIDASGAFGLPVQAVSWQRMLGAGCVVAGLLLSRV